ncbi:MAG: type I restriction-modification system endonuclease [Alteromonadaceae bacterium]|nr:type I restriction-modification system endonuclease [Alteromonadaceae bacterium]
MSSFISNFEFLKHHDELLFRLAETAERCYAADPNTSLIKMRQLGEAIAQNVAARVGVEFGKQIKQINLLRDLDFTLKLDENVKDAFHSIRQLGNIANHQYLSSSHRDALKSMQIGCALSGWYHVTFGGDKAKGFKFKAFIKPVDPSDYVRELEEIVNALKIESQRSSDRLVVVEQLNKVTEEKAEAEKQRADTMAQEKAIWESLAQDQENTIEALSQQAVATNLQYVTDFTKLEKQKQTAIINQVEQSNFLLDEEATRILIDQQLNDRGWLADTVNIRYSKGSKPERNKNKAIAEWPTDSGPADYVLFMGLTPVATIEAKRSRKNVYSAIDQAKRYASGLKTQHSFEITDTWGDFKVPLTFATNGRPYLKQLEQESGIWFLDVRDNSNRRKALKGWFLPDEIKKYLKQTPQQADQKLNEMNFAYDLKLRDYQIDAIKAIESTIKQGKSRALVAMATGTGKTKTCIALVYRLLKAERFRRILFLVDRSALGIQATDDFTEVRMENLQTFADTFDLMGMQINKSVSKKPDDETKVHIATVQGLVQRILYPSDNPDGSNNKPGIGQYDCIVVDECHRGYLLDRELSDTEIEFRNQKDYQSKYRAVIEYFNAFKIGLTATPALHTVDIFGEPVYSYSYTDAVIDGYLIDHLPPIRIHTKLAEQGIHYQVNEAVQVYDAANSSIETYNTPDELDFDVAEFNRKVISADFTKVVTKWLIESDAIDPYSAAKTLVFCVTDKHADQVVEAFKEACEYYHGEIDDDAIQKITGASDKPLDKIKRFKNDRLPNIAVTVDLLTTGIDVPAISNLVFLRRVNSRILFEQMLGRATRRCDEIGKETFRIYDAVDIYKQLEKVNSMKPVVTKVDITFAELEHELTHSASTELQQLAKDQFLAKLHSKRRHLTDTQADNFERIVGKAPQEFAQQLKSMKLAQIAQWFTNHPGLGELLDMRVQGGSGTAPIVLSHHEDKIIDITHGYGDGQKPEDYLKTFKAFINANSNRLVAIQTVIQRPWQLTRQSLKELAFELEKNNFREQNLCTAWQEVKNEEIAARIIGFIRQAAIGEALIPFETRVDNALAKILTSQQWKTPQKQWLQAIAKQMKATTIVDDVALDNGIFKQQLGGIKRANKLFAQPITQVLADFNYALWAS